MIVRQVKNVRIWIDGQELPVANCRCIVEQITVSDWHPEGRSWEGELARRRERVRRRREKAEREALMPISAMRFILDKRGERA